MLIKKSQLNPKYEGVFIALASKGGRDLEPQHCIFSTHSEEQIKLTQG